MTSDSSTALAQILGDETFAAAMKRFADAFPAYREHLPRIPYAYSRTRLFATPAFEIIAMSWAPQSISPIHDHGPSRCWVLMLEGTLDVQNFTCSDPARDGPLEIAATQRLTLRSGDVDHRLGPSELHRVGNPHATDRAVSLQLYAAPLSTYCVVDARSHVRRTVTAACNLDLGFD
ncbi:MAG TPA: cysteine dioxygenase family protein [Candidatus Tumulicola sp.]|jgi:predicted metal-dependent enzyme (double-stranded beta helix superfamily)